MSAPDRVRNVSDMLLFVAVVETGSFTAAARRLGLSKAYVSKAVAGLEQRLGAQLLRRTTRKMSLTEIGEAFHERCQRVAEEAEAAELSVSRLQAEPRGEIRLAAPMSFGHLRLAPLLPGFVERYPEVRVDVDLTDRRIDLVQERFDLAVRIGRRGDASLVARKLAPVRAAIVASPAYLERAGTPRDPEDLREHNCLGYRSPPEVWSFTRGRTVPTRGNLNIDNGDALRRAALAGLGVVFLPTFLIGDDVREGRLVHLLVDDVSAEAGIWAVYPGSRHLSPKVRALIDYLVEQLGPEPEWDRFAAA